MKFILLIFVVIVVFIGVYSYEYPMSFIPSAFQHLHHSKHVTQDSLIVAELVWLNILYSLSNNVTVFGHQDRGGSYEYFSIQSINEHTRFMDKSIEFGMNVTMWPEYVVYQNETHLCTQSQCEERGDIVFFFELNGILICGIICIILIRLEERNRVKRYEEDRESMELIYLFPDHQIGV